MPCLGKAQRARLPPLNYGSPHYLTRPSTSPDNCILPSRPWQADKLPLSRGTLQYSAVRPGAGGWAPPAPGFGGDMTGKTQQRFYAIYFHERRVGGTRSPKENPAGVPLAAKDRVGAPLSKGPFGRDGISTLRFLVAGGETPALETFASIHRKKEMPPPRAYTA